ncbi:MAG: class II aldolase/adducin family protein, partial [Armatimonadota bacterium]
ITEVAVTLWEVPCARFAPPGSPEVPQAALPMLQHADAFLLRNHGVVTVGRDIWEAHHRMEWVEQGAQVATVIEQHGGGETLGAERLRELQAIREELGLGVDPVDYRPEGCIERILEGWGESAEDQ